jgi:membrane peptidoglycan carboxypeptidase
MVQFAARLTAGEKYELLRDLGFGTQTGVPLPAEATGTLRPPKTWSRQTAASLVMGYEVAVTALQLALGYAAFANGGVLMEPQFIKQIRDAEGNVIFRARRRAVRRVFTPDAANSVRAMLLGVVESGTAIKADLANYTVGGKSGTARRVEVGRGYAPGKYTASFVGLFPGEDPQYVVLVKLDDPRGVIYGGETAAPVTRVVLEAALAARDAALDRDALADADRRTVDSFASAQRSREQGNLPASQRVSSNPASAGWTLPAARDTVDAAVATQQTSVIIHRTSRPRVFDLPVAAPPKRRITLAARAVPDVTTLPLRAAVRTLHEAGFRVVLAHGPAAHARPAPGTVLPAGAIVRLTVSQ